MGTAQTERREPSDDADTTAESPVAVRTRSGMRRSRSDTSSWIGGSEFTERPSVTPRETLYREEISRTRIFVVVTGLFGIFVAFAILALRSFAVLRGDRAALQLLMAGLGLLVAWCGWFAWVLRRDEGYSVARVNAFTLVGILTCYAGIWYFGIFSAATALVPFGLGFAGLGQNRRASLGAYALSAGLYALLTGLVVTGAARDVGFLSSEGLSRSERIFAAVLIQGIFVATFVLQRRTREVTATALEKHDRVLRSLAQRDALLRETQLELAQARQVGGIGRWTGETVGGFLLGNVIGRGAMGEVYEATAQRDGGLAAVKLLHPHLLAKPDFVRRFVREARLVAALRAPSVVRVLDVAPPDARVPYLAMERLVGRDLAEYLREHKRMGIRGVLVMLRQVGQGLDAAREAGIVHRDLKPRNIFLVGEADREAWKILDFGVARVLGEETLTQDQIIGTPNYMAPEQAIGAAVTHSADLFALGAIAYRALTGHPAFEGETSMETLYKVVHTMPLRPSAAAPLTAAIDLVLAIAIAKDPSDRFASAGEFVAALEDASRGRVDPGRRLHAERLLAKLPWRKAPE